MRASRVSKRTGETFVTRKDRRMFDKAYLDQTRPRARRVNRKFGPDGMVTMVEGRRAKGTIREGDHQWV